MAYTLLALIAGYLLLYPYATEAGGEKVEVYLFWKETCSFCKKEKVFLEDLKREYPSIVVADFEISKNPENAKLMERTLKAYDQKRSAVPVTVVGDKLWIGFTETKATLIRKQVEHCLDTPCGGLNERLEAKQAETAPK